LEKSVKGGKTRNIKGVAESKYESIVVFMLSNILPAVSLPEAIALKLTTFSKITITIPTKY
jgi:hypothetical protein